MNSPNRRFELRISIGADSWNDVITALNCLQYDAGRHLEDEVLNVTSGGPSFGYIVISRKDQEQTHEAYFQEVDQWLADKRAEDPNA